MPTKEELIQQTVELIINAQQIVVFTGAGVSADSRMPDVRSMTTPSADAAAGSAFPNFRGDPASRRRSWQTWNMFRMIAMAEPNPAHYAVSELHKMNKLDCVITQNVDGLHQKAGVPDEKVIELHGSLRRLKCLNCGETYGMLDIAKKLGDGEAEQSVCTCGGILKSATVAFGETPPAKEIEEAEQHSRNCDLFMLLGSSLMVYPAADMPIHAIEAGAKLIIINMGAASLDDKADVLFNTTTVGQILPRILERVKSKLPSPEPEPSQ
jgi:NAD-dependent deacetylase